MHFDEFAQSTLDKNPPEKLNQYALSLWYDAKGDWASAHTIIQDIEDKTAAWIHAYLHRKEGDAGNAGYWYNRAGKKMATVSLEKEWEDIARVILSTQYLV